MSVAISPTVLPPPTLRIPSLDNQSPAEWELHREIAYVFARHARHDLVNVQCSLQLIEVVEKMRELGSDVPLPAELQPEQVKIKVKQSLKQMVSMTNDQVLLSQAASPAAYREAHTVTWSDLLEEAITSRLGDQAAHAPALPSGPAAQGRVVALGDMLQAALAACFFQWTPWLHPLSERPCRLVPRGRGACAMFPISDQDMVTGFADRLSRDHGTSDHPALHEPRTIPTGDLALWIAQFIVRLHGGHLAVDLDSPEPAISVCLPLAQ